MTCAVRAHQKLGDVSAARTFMLKQVAMLQTDEYRNDADAFETVASWCRSDPASLERFAELLRENARRPAFLSNIDWSKGNVLDRLRDTPAAGLGREIARDALRSRPSDYASITMAAYMLDMLPSPDAEDVRLVS